MATFEGHEVNIPTQSGGDVSGLSNRQYVLLGRSIASPDMESIALGYLNFDEETIKNLRYENRDNAEAFNRDILKRWAYQNPGPDQVEVRTGVVVLLFFEIWGTFAQMQSIIPLKPLDPNFFSISNNTWKFWQMFAIPSE